LKVFRFVAREWQAALMIVLFLIAQAACELALPGYMSDMVDVGIQQGGIHSAAAEQLTPQGYQDVRLLVAPEDLPLFDSAYQFQDDSWTLTVTDEEQLRQVEQTLSLPMSMLFLLSQQGPQGAMGLEALRSGALSPQAARQMAQEMLGQQEAQQDMLLRQGASGFIKEQYQQLGLDTTAIQQSYMWQKGLMMLGLTLLMGLAAVSGSFVGSRAAARIGRDLRGRVFRRVISFSRAEIDRFSTASLITRSGNDIRQIEHASTMTLRMFLYAPIMGVIGIVRVARLQSGLSPIVMVAVVMAASLVGLLAGRAVPKFRIIQKLVDRQNLVAREILTGLPVVRAFTRERFEEKRFEKANRDIIEVNRFINSMFIALMPAMMLIMNITMLSIVWFGARRIDLGHLQVGSMMAMISYTMYIIMAFMMLSMGAIMLPRANASSQRVLEVLNTPSSIEEPETPAALPQRFSGEVRFDGVSFRYPGAEDDVLSDLSFTARPGQMTAIIGGTGSGKTTVLNLIPRMYDVTQGSVSIDGVDVRQMPLPTLRGLIGYVPQQGVLFSGTIATNIKFADGTIPQEEMERAARIAQAEGFINEKEEGYDSPVSRGGSNVSGGQRQRLSIARAIAARPRVLLFDDSFSALDYRTDLNLRQALSREMEDTAVIVVAQRVATVMRADNILVLDQGRLVGEGTHRQLLRDNDIYRAIAQSQLSQEELEGGMA